MGGLRRSDAKFATRVRGHCWFLAAPSLKKAVCSDACRFKKYQSKKGYKKKRREYMRGYMRKPSAKGPAQVESLQPSLCDVDHGTENVRVREFH